MPKRNPWVSTLVIGLLLVAALCWGLFLFLSHLAAVAPGNERLLTDTSVRGLFAERFFLARALTGLVFLVAAPQILRAALALFKTPPVPRANVTLTGLLLATSLYVALWASPARLLYALLAPAALSAVIIVGVFRIGLKKSLMVWATQLVIAAAMLSGCLLLSLRFSSGSLPSIGEATALARLVQTHDAQSASSRRIVKNARLPVSIPFTWESTGSNWLDALASDILFEVTSVPPGALLDIEIVEDGTIVYSDQTQAAPSRLHWRVTPGRPYELRITGQGDADVRVAAFGVLQPVPPSP